MGILDFFSREAGQQRRAALNEALNDAARYYLGPSGVDERIKVAGLLNPVNDMEQAGQNAQRLAGGDAGAIVPMLTDMAGVLAPAGAVKYAGGPATSAVVEGLLGMGAPTRQGLDDAARKFAADESGALNLPGKAREAARLIEEKYGIKPEFSFHPTGYGNSAYVNARIPGPNGTYVDTGFRLSDHPTGEARKATDGIPTVIDDGNITPEGLLAQIDGAVERAKPALEQAAARRAINQEARAAWDALPANQVRRYKKRAKGMFGGPDEGGFELFKRAYSEGGPAAIRGDEVLTMLRNGRASDITDDMLDMGDPTLNARLNEYLFNNYDLPMDGASRMRRAIQQDFEVNDEMYRGDAPRQSFETGRGQRDQIGVTMSSRPDVAASYIPARGEGGIYPIVSRGMNDADIEAQGQNWNVILPDTPVSFQGEASQLSDYIPEDYFEPYDVMAGTAFVDTNDLSRMFQGYGADRIRFNDLVDRGGSAKYYGPESAMPSDVMMVADPSNIRSRFARFDPRLSHLRNLSAGVGGLGLLGVLTQDDERAINQYINGGS